MSVEAAQIQPQVEKIPQAKSKKKLVLIVSAGLAVLIIFILVLSIFIIPKLGNGDTSGNLNPTQTKDDYNVSPTKAGWPSTDAKYITFVPVDLTQILSISKYRSCAGHVRAGYSFDRILETDRSMKHYFYPVPEFQGTLDKVEMYAPFDGTVAALDFEKDKIGGRPHNGNGIKFSNPVDPNVIFGFGHLYFVKDFQIGDTVKAGDLIGYAALADPGNDFDIDLMGMNGIVNAEILGSIFDHMTDNVLAEFVVYGITPENTKVTKEYRDAHPCNFSGPEQNNSLLGGRDNSESWVQLVHP